MLFRRTVFTKTLRSVIKIAIYYETLQESIVYITNNEYEVDTK